MTGRAHMARQLARGRSVREALQRLQERAADLIAATGAMLEPWMLWAGWCKHVGCDRCFDAGPKAECWGLASCHGYANGCGCLTCCERDVRAIAACERGAAI